MAAITNTLQVNLPTKAWSFTAPEKKGAIISEPTENRTFEACGEWLQKSLWAAQVKKTIVQQIATKTAVGTASSSGATSKDRVRTGGAKLSEEDLETNWYEIMDIKEETAHLMDAEELRNVFRKRCIESHPDKQPDHSDKLFKQVARGYEILGSEGSRRAYDSSRLFDDSIPRKDVAEANYYTAFGPVFERNMKFSLDLPLPSLGDDDTPIKDVKKFYDAWYRFRSWRDFSSQCELEKVDENMDRDEKRYHQRENQRKLDKLAKEEMKRIRELVDRANEADPRLRRAREAEAAAIEKAKAEREAERERLQFERTRAAREAAEAEKKAAADKIARAKNDKEALKDLRLSLMAFFKDNELLDPSQSAVLCDDEVKQKNINWLSQKSNAEQIANLMEEITKKSVEKDGEGKVEAVLFFNACVKQTEEDVGQNRYGEAIKSTKQKQKEEEARLHAIEMAKPMRERKVATYEPEEELRITRAAAKFGGAWSADRCKKIASTLGDSKKFSEEQLKKKVAEIEEKWVADPKSKPVAPDMSHKARLVRHLEKYNPEKVHMADAMLKKYEGKEEDWIKALIKKFGPEPEPEWK